jgi:hypothetical protein
MSRSAVDVATLNDRLRAIGVSERELLVERKDGGFHLIGTIPDAHSRREDDVVGGLDGYEPAGHLISYTVFGLEGLVKQLDEFAPGWR